MYNVVAVVTLDKARNSLFFYIDMQTNVWYNNLGWVIIEMEMKYERQTNVFN